MDIIMKMMEAKLSMMEVEQLEVLIFGLIKIEQN